METTIQAAHETEGTNTPQDQKSTYPSLQDLKSEKLAKTMESLKSGFTRLPNEILMEIVHGNLSKAEIQIVLLVARYTISFEGRETASLSKADIIRYTELQGKTVLQAMKSLEERGLILKIKGDQYTPNKLGLIYSADHLKAKKIVANQEEKPKVSEGEKGTYPADQKSTYFKDSSSNDNLKDSLSKTPILENYFSQIRAPKKVERERGSFQSCRQKS